MSTRFDPLSDPVTRLAVDTFAGGADDLRGTIDRRDEMFRYNLDLLYGNEQCAATLYFLKGWQIALAVREIAESFFGGLDRVGSLLDFGSGFGRATRFLIRELAPERVWAADIVAEAVAFQQDCFRVNPLLSTADPDALRVDRRFDYVFVSSLFSHLPAATFGRWLGRLGALLEDGGLLALSVLDAALLGPDGSAAPGGIVFYPESESRVLPGEEYGTAYVTEAFVRAQIRAALGERAAVVRLPAGLCGHQDLYLVAPGAEPPAALRALRAPRLRRFPKGDLDRLERVGETVEVGGWARDTDPDGGISEVLLWSAGRGQAGRTRPAQTTADPSDPALARWRARLDLDLVGRDDMVVIVARDHHGGEGPIALGTLRPFIGG